MSSNAKLYDVVVAGGGPSGIAAAIASARAGAKTLLVDRNGYLGGHLPGVSIQHGFFDQTGKQCVFGIPFEIVERAREHNGAFRRIKLNHPGTKAAVAVDHAVFKYVVTELLLEAGCEIVLDTMVTGQRFDTDGGVVLSIFNKSGASEVKAKVVVDATGDADVAAGLGAEYKVGRDADGKAQPITLFFGLRNCDLEKTVQFMQMPFGRNEDPLPGQPAGRVAWFDGSLHHWAAEAEAEDLFPHVADKKTLLICGYQMFPGEVSMNATFVNNVDPLDAAALTRARNECQRQAFRLIPFLRKHVPGYENAELTWLSPTLFVRDSRRIVGDYVITYDDFRNARRFDDVVGRSGYIAAIHNPDPKGGLELVGNANQSVTGEPFDLPYRALLPKGIDNVVVCGRSISASPEALSSARTAGAVMTTGQAAGAAAGLSALQGVTPRALSVPALQDELVKHKADLGR